MKKSMKVSGIALAFLSVMVFMGVSLFTNEPALGATNVIKWKCQAHTPPAPSGHYKEGLLAAVDEIKKRTDGRLVIEPYGEGSFVPAREISNAVRRGMLEAGFTSSAYIQSQVPLAAVSNGMPFGLGDTWEAAYFIQILGIEQMMNEAVMKLGMYYFSDSVNSWELALKKPIRTFEDFKGLKLRSSGTLEKYFGSIGAAPTFLPASEFYTALATGVVNGGHFGDAIGNDSLKAYEICKYSLTTPLLFGAPTIWLVNKKAFDSLPPDLQQILRSTLVEHFWKHTFVNKHHLQETYSKIEKQNKVQIISLPNPEYEKMQKSALKFWDETAAINPECARGIKILKDFNKSLGRLQGIQ